MARGKCRSKESGISLSLSLFWSRKPGMVNKRPGPRSKSTCRVLSPCSRKFCGSPFSVDDCTSRNFVLMLSEVGRQPPPPFSPLAPLPLAVAHSKIFIMKVIVCHFGQASHVRVFVSVCICVCVCVPRPQSLCTTGLALIVLWLAKTLGAPERQVSATEKLFTSCRTLIESQQQQEQQQNTGKFN